MRPPGGDRRTQQRPKAQHSRLLGRLSAVMMQKVLTSPPTAVCPQKIAPQRERWSQMMRPPSNESGMRWTGPFSGKVPSNWAGRGSLGRVGKTRSTSHLTTKLHHNLCAEGISSIRNSACGDSLPRGGKLAAPLKMTAHSASLRALRKNVQWEAATMKLSYRLDPWVSEC